MAKDESRFARRRCSIEPDTISRSVAQTPSASVRTSTAPSDGGRCETSSSLAESRLPGATVIARKTVTIHRGAALRSESKFSDRALLSHETACILNAGQRDANIAITIYFADREPVGPYRVTVGARRTLHLRFNDLVDPQPVPRDTDYASVFEASEPIIVQHTRLDSRRAELALLSTIAYAEG